MGMLSNLLAIGIRSAAGGQLGFTLYELMITLSIASGLMTAGSGLHRIVHDHRVTAEINQFLGHLGLARSEAMKRGVKTALCPSSNGRECDTGEVYTGWQNGALMLVDTDADGKVESSDSMIRVLPGAERLVIKSTHETNKIVFQPNGLTPGTNRTFTLCAAAGASKPRYIVISNTGRARVSSAPPAGSPAEGCG
jgi:type IV fimbrial biogenesis protein FimT